MCSCEWSNSPSREIGRIITLAIQRCLFGGLLLCCCSDGAKSAVRKGKLYTPTPERTIVSSSELRWMASPSDRWRDDGCSVAGNAIRRFQLPSNSSLLKLGGRVLLAGSLRPLDGPQETSLTGGWGRPGRSRAIRGGVVGRKLGPLVLIGGR